MALSLNAMTLVPLLALVGTALGILLAQSWRPPWRLSAWSALAGIATAMVLALIVVLSGQGGSMQGMLSLDGTSALFIVFCSATGATAILLELGSVGNEDGGRYAIMLFALAGVTIVAQATHILPIVLGLAIVHIAASALVDPRRAWQLLVPQSIALGCVLLGLALLYGATGTLRTGILRAPTTTTANPLELLGLSMLTGGSLLSLGVVPFHVWVSEVVQRTGVREGYLLTLLLPQVVVALLAGLADNWPPELGTLLLILGALSVLYGYTKGVYCFGVRGALSGIAIAQSGMLAVSIALASPKDKSVLFYALAVHGLNLACLWTAVANMRRTDDQPLTLDDLDGLARRRPWLAGALAVCLLNLTGAPPFAGFMALLSMLRTAASQHRGWLVVPVVAGSLVAWLTSSRWIVRMWACPARARQWVPTTPEIAVITLGSAGMMALAGVFAETVWSWLAVLLVA